MPVTKRLRAAASLIGRRRFSSRARAPGRKKLRQKASAKGHVFYGNQYVQVSTRNKARKTTSQPTTHATPTPAQTTAVNRLLARKRTNPLERPRVGSRMTSTEYAAIQKKLGTSSKKPKLTMEQAFVKGFLKGFFAKD